MNSGDLVAVNYGEVPPAGGLWHVRLLLFHVTGNWWVIATPDLDVYEEELFAGNPDFVNFMYLGAGLGAPLPAGINAAHVHGFGPLTAIEYQQFMTQGRVVGLGLQAVLGVAPPPSPPIAGGGPVGAALAVPVPPPPLPIIALPWLALDTESGYSRGDVVVVAGAPLPLGTLQLGDKILVPIAGGSPVACKQCGIVDQARLSNDDLRTFPVFFNSQGLRRRTFANAALLQSREVLPGGDLQLLGPPTAMELIGELHSRGFTFSTDSEHWIRTEDIPKSDRSLFELEVLDKVLEALATVDQPNLPNLKGAELLLRRRQVIREAHRLSASSPDYSMADIMMGWERKSGVAMTLRRYVADEMKDQAAILKESRKAREELSAKRGDPTGRGRGARGRGGRGTATGSAEDG